jgi:hypothetical protein
MPAPVPAARVILAEQNHGSARGLVWIADSDRVDWLDRTGLTGWRFFAGRRIRFARNRCMAGSNFGWICWIFLQGGIDNANIVRATQNTVAMTFGASSTTLGVVAALHTLQQIGISTYRKARTCGLTDHKTQRDKNR